MSNADGRKDTRSCSFPEQRGSVPDTLATSERRVAGKFENLWHAGQNRSLVRQIYSSHFFESRLGYQRDPAKTAWRIGGKGMVAGGSLLASHPQLESDKHRLRIEPHAPGPFDFGLNFIAQGDDFGGPRSPAVNDGKGVLGGDPDRS